jgi:hypothetical protein
VLKQGLNVGVFASAVPVHKHIARETDSVARVRSLAASGAISTTSLWQHVGAVAVNSWQAFAAQALITAVEMKAIAAKSLAKAEADLKLVTDAEALVAAKKDTDDMSDAELTTAIKFVYVAVPAQPVVRTSFKCKAEKAAFLGSLSSCWSLLLPGVRLACDAASAAASTAMAEAIAAETAALVENAPPEAPTVAPAPRAVTAAAVDVQSMTAAEKRALLAKLADEMA